MNSVLSIVSPDAVDQSSYQLPPPMSRKQVEALAKVLGIPTPLHIGGNLYSICVPVTREMAKRWLEHNNISNRNKSSTQLYKVGDDLKNKQWRLNHQGAAFRADGKLQDSQHRFSEIARTGVTAWMVINFNVTDEAQRTIDSGKSRSATDVAKIAGIEGIDSRRIATIRMAVIATRDAKKNRGWSNARQIEVVQHHREAIEWVIANLNSKANKISSPVRAAVLIAWYRHPQSRDLLERYCHVLREGLPPAGAALTNGDRTAVRLREFIHKGIPHDAAGRKELFSKTCKNISWFLEDRAATNLVELSQAEIDSRAWTLPESDDVDTSDDDEGEVDLA